MAKKQFTITSLSVRGAKSIATQYQRFGYELVSQAHNEKKEVYESTFKDKD